MSAEGLLTSGPRLPFWDLVKTLVIDGEEDKKAALPKKGALPKKSYFLAWQVSTRQRLRYSPSRGACSRILTSFCMMPDARAGEGNAQRPGPGE